MTIQLFNGVIYGAPQRRDLSLMEGKTAGARQRPGCRINSPLITKSLVMIIRFSFRGSTRLWTACPCLLFCRHRIPFWCTWSSLCILHRFCRSFRPCSKRSRRVWNPWILRPGHRTPKLHTNSNRRLLTGNKYNALFFLDLKNYSENDDNDNKAIKDRARMPLECLKTAVSDSERSGLVKGEAADSQVGRDDSMVGVQNRLESIGWSDR